MGGIRASDATVMAACRSAGSLWPGAIATTIEWYDFFLYGVVTPIVPAGVVTFLASNSAAFITGAVVPVDGSILTT